MLFDSTVRRELARSFGATLVVILTIVLTIFLIRTIGQAASGKVAPADVVFMLGFVTLGHLPTMLALSLFVAIVLTLGRMFRDSEMVIWFASGAGLSRFLRPVLATSWPVLAVIGFGLVGVAPALVVVLVFQILRRAGNFAIQRPAREVLYTVLPRTEKYKAKNFNDTFVYRVGDQVGAWSYTLMGSLGLGVSSLALTMVPVSAVWLVLALWLGVRYRQYNAGT